MKTLTSSIMASAACIAAFLAVGTASLLATSETVQARSGCGSFAHQREVAVTSRSQRIERIAAIRANLSEMNSTDPGVVNREFNSWYAKYRYLHAIDDKETPAMREKYAPVVRATDDALAFWRAKKTELESGGLISGSGSVGNAFIAYEKGQIASLESAIESNDESIRELNGQIAQCGRSASSVGSVHTNWNGTYTDGPFTITVSGGFGSLGYKALRSEGEGTCCPLTDSSKGTCTVSGAEAKCTWDGDYRDSAKHVKSSGTATLTLSGDTISIRSVVNFAEYADSQGNPCGGAIETCTGIHPGAEFSGIWTRKP